jgi:hypothetical protein
LIDLLTIKWKSQKKEPLIEMVINYMIQTDESGLLYENEIEKNLLPLIKLGIDLRTYLYS